MTIADRDLVFDGEDDYIEIPDHADFSVATTGALTASAWIRPDVLMFPVFQSTGYVHWMGKGEAGRHEWTFRMYNHATTDNPPRPNRISFYVFNPRGGLGIGSYFQEPVVAGEWIHVVGMADGENTSIYKNGEFKDRDRYIANEASQTDPSTRWITPARGSAPLRIGTRDRKSFFLGAISDVRLWDRALTAAEVAGLFAGTVPQDGLVAEYLLSADIAVDSRAQHNGVIAGASWVAEGFPE